MFDHFRVYICLRGAKRLLTSIHADNTSKQFSYTHYYDPAVVGPFRFHYEIVPVDLNFNDLPAVSSKKTSPARGATISNNVASKSKVTKKYGQQNGPAAKPTSLNGYRRGTGQKSIQQERQEKKKTNSRSGSKDQRR